MIHSRRLTGLIGVVTVIGCLAGCGGDDKKAATVTTPPPATATTTTKTAPTATTVPDPGCVGALC